ncbi:hypothetical protein M409DRAFT_58209 [Zasmidium cellare ATCC 36951]|uniref:Uncharacterized protein n=1 Tax=Zasmidium cellare ATCC 36951 TaxID=1080233 RepID=A0A6A6C9W0_ZASCE|nr:uncharacterized protein M409DRAFT_58209 [Zasmidium cellare ATCC 36951]KAF2162439.1 hypothetical protein M409DRAFT_58209 [Zasmidium cellare ATCC 36951]
MTVEERGNITQSQISNRIAHTVHKAPGSARADTLQYLFSRLSRHEPEVRIASMMSSHTWAGSPGNLAQDDLHVTRTGHPLLFNPLPSVCDHNLTNPLPEKIFDIQEPPAVAVENHRSHADARHQAPSAVLLRQFSRPYRVCDTVRTLQQQLSHTTDSSSTSHESPSSFSMSSNEDNSFNNSNSTNMSANQLPLMDDMDLFSATGDYDPAILEALLAANDDAWPAFSLENEEPQSSAGGMDPTSPPSQPLAQYGAPTGQSLGYTNNNHANGFSGPMPSNHSFKQSAPISKDRMELDTTQFFARRLPQASAPNNGTAPLMTNMNTLAVQRVPGMVQLGIGERPSTATDQHFRFVNARRPTHFYLSTLQQHQAHHSINPQAQLENSYPTYLPQVTTGHSSAQVQLRNKSSSDEILRQRPALSRSTTGSLETRVELNGQYQPGNTSTEDTGHHNKASAQNELHNESLDKDDAGQESFEGILDDLEDLTEDEELDEENPFTAAKEWIKECEEVITPYYLAKRKDDVDEVMKPEKVIEIAARIRKALLAQHQEPAAHWTDIKKSRYEKTQVNARAQLEKILSDDHGQKKALAQEIRLVGYVCKVHAEGIPKAHLKDKKTSGAKLYDTELKMNAQSAARNRKALNAGSNANKNETIKLGREVERNAEAAALGGSGSPSERADSEQLDAEAGAEDSEAAEIRTRPKRRGRKAFSTTQKLISSQGLPSKRSKRNRTALTEDDGEDQEEVTYSKTSKRTKSPTAGDFHSTRRAPRGGGRKKNRRRPLTNFPASPETASVAQSTQSTPIVDLEDDEINYEQPLAGDAQQEAGFTANGGNQGTAFDPMRQQPDAGWDLQAPTMGMQLSLQGANKDWNELNTEEQEAQQSQVGQGLLFQTGAWTNGGQGVYGVGESEVDEQQTDLQDQSTTVAPTASVAIEGNELWNGLFDVDVQQDAYHLRVQFDEESMGRSNEDFDGES